MTATNKGIETVDRAYVGGRYRRESYHRFWCINRALFSFGFACFFFLLSGNTYDIPTLTLILHIIIGRQTNAIIVRSDCEDCTRYIVCLVRENYSLLS